VKEIEFCQQQADGCVFEQFAPLLRGGKRSDGEAFFIECDPASMYLLCMLGNVALLSLAGRPDIANENYIKIQAFQCSHGTERMHALYEHLRAIAFTLDGMHPEMGSHDSE